MNNTVFHVKNNLGTFGCSGPLKLFILHQSDNILSTTCSICNLENDLFYTFFHSTPVNKFWDEILVFHHTITNEYTNSCVEYTLLAISENNFSLNFTVLYDCDGFLLQWTVPVFSNFTLFKKWGPRWQSGNTLASHH